jgi:type IV secretory pathway TrbD component
MVARQDMGLIPGYQAPIHQALTRRITTAGVPRMWFILEIIGAIFLAFVLFSVFRSWVAVVPFVVAGLMHIGFVLLMRWDPDFDSVLLYSVRYKSHYHAG